MTSYRNLVISMALCLPRTAGSVQRNEDEPGMICLESDRACLDEMIEFAKALPVKEIDQ